MATPAGAKHHATGTTIAGSPFGVWWSWITLAVFFLGVNITEALLWRSGGEMPTGAVYLLRFVSLFLFWQWLELECRPYRQRYPLDMGMFLYAAAFVVIPYYLWRNQRWRGLGKVLGMAALWGVTYLVAEGAAFLFGTIVGE